VSLNLHAMARGTQPGRTEDPAACLAAAAELLEGLPDEELEGLRNELSAVAGDLAQPGDVRRLAAQLTGAVEGARSGLVSWDALLAAGGQVNTIRNETKG
jgi:hypothetical protein